MSSKTFDAEMEKHAETLRALAEIVSLTPKALALLADWKQRGEEIERLKRPDGTVVFTAPGWDAAVLERARRTEEAEAERDRLHAQMYSSQPYYYDYWKKELAENERLRADVKETTQIAKENGNAAARLEARAQKAEARIEAAQAAYEARRLLAPERHWRIVEKMVKALQGEK